MITSEQEFLDYLDTNQFAYERIEHPAVFTCAEAETHRPSLPGVSTKPCSTTFFSSRTFPGKS